MTAERPSPQRRTLDEQAFLDHCTTLGELGPPEEGFRITALPVGSGQSLVVQSPTRTMLVDAGPPANDPGQQLGPFGAEGVPLALELMDIDRIDELVITSLDSDHAGQAWRVLDQFGPDGVGRVHLSPRYEDEWRDTSATHFVHPAERLRRRLDETAIPVEYREAGDRFTLSSRSTDDPSPVTVLVHNPRPGVAPREADPDEISNARDADSVALEVWDPSTDRNAVLPADVAGEHAVEMIRDAATGEHFSDVDPPGFREADFVVDLKHGTWQRAIPDDAADDRGDLVAALDDEAPRGDAGTATPSVGDLALHDGIDTLVACSHRASRYDHPRDRTLGLYVTETGPDTDAYATAVHGCVTSSLTDDGVDTWSSAGRDVAPTPGAIRSRVHRHPDDVPDDVADVRDVGEDRGL